MRTIGQRASLSLMNVHVYDFVKKISLPVCLSSYANNNNRIIETPGTDIKKNQHIIFNLKICCYSKISHEDKSGNCKRVFYFKMVLFYDCLAHFSLRVTKTNHNEIT